MRYIMVMLMVLCCLVNYCLADFRLIVKFSDVGNNFYPCQEHGIYIYSTPIDGNYVLVSGTNNLPVSGTFTAINTVSDSMGNIVCESEDMNIVLTLGNDFDSGGRDIWYNLTVKSVDGNVLYFTGNESVWSENAINNEIPFVEGICSYDYETCAQRKGGYGGYARVLPDSNDWSNDWFFKFEGIVNFIDFAIFANSWMTENPFISLDEDTDVDIDDLKIFCEHWLEKPNLP